MVRGGGLDGSEGMWRRGNIDSISTSLIIHLYFPLHSSSISSSFLSQKKKSRHLATSPPRHHSLSSLPTVPPPFFHYPSSFSSARPKTASSSPNLFHKSPSSRHASWTFFPFFSLTYAAFLSLYLVGLWERGGGGG